MASEGKGKGKAKDHLLRVREGDQAKLLNQGDKVTLFPKYRAPGWFSLSVSLYSIGAIEEEESNSNSP